MDSVHCLRHKITHGWESSLFGRRHRQNNETYSGLGIVSLITYKVAVRVNGVSVVQSFYNWCMKFKLGA